MNWFREACSSGGTGRLSSSRMVALVAGLTLSACTAILTVASFFKIELATPLTVFGGALAGLAGANYVANRVTAKGSSE